MSLLVLILISCIDLLPSIFLFIISFKQNLKLKTYGCYIVTLVLVSVIIALYLCLIHILPQLDSSRFITTCITTAILCITIYSFTDLTVGQTLFITFLMRNFVDDIHLMVVTTYTRQPLHLNSIDMDYVQRLAFFSILFFPFLYYFVKKVFQPLLNETSSLSIWNYICFIPIVLFLLYRLSTDPSYFNQDYTWHAHFVFLPATWSFGTLAIYYTTIKSMSIINSKIKLERELHYTKILAASSEKQYLALKEYIMDAKRLRHDFRHSLIVLYQYAQDGNNDKILEHLTSYIDALKPNSGTPICENASLNTILIYYISLAQSEGIEVKSFIDVPNKLDLPDTELCVLTGNLMENAFEASRKVMQGKRFIHIRMQMSSRKILSLIISNSYEGEVQQKNGKFISSKHSGYGIGLSSVKHITEKYNGIMRVEIKDSVFKVSILLNIVSPSP